MTNHKHHDWKRDLNRSTIADTKLGRQLGELFSKHLSGATSSSRSTDSPLSFKTQYSKCKALINAVTALKNLREVHIRSLWQIEPHHINALCAIWVADGNTKGGIENKLSHMRSLAQWLRKPHLVPDTDSIPEIEHLPIRSGIATRDKSWEGNQVNVGETIEAAMRLDVHVGAQLLLQITLGLRKEESFLFRPKTPLIQNKDGYIALIEHGTKGGRVREVALTNPMQKAVLDYVKIFANSKSGSTIPLNYTLQQWDNHYYYIVRKLGITKKDSGVTSHGLRHQNLQGIYKKITGFDAPVKALVEGVVSMNAPSSHDEARQIVALVAGHSKLSKSNAYLGAVMRTTGGKRKSKRESVTNEMILGEIKKASGNKKQAAINLGISRPYLYKRLGLMVKIEINSQAPNNSNPPKDDPRDEGDSLVPIA